MVDDFETGGLEAFDEVQRRAKRRELFSLPGKKCGCAGGRANKAIFFC